MQYVLLSVLLSPCLSQMIQEMKPDVTFGEDNDRFDLSSMLARQNSKVYLDKDGGAEESEEYRRSANNGINQLAADLREKVRRNRDFSTFSYHDNMDSRVGGDVEDFERSLRSIKSGRRFQSLVQYLQGKQNRRSASSLDSEQEALHNHAVPVLMTINGYLQQP